MNNKVKALFVGLNTIDLQFFVQGYPMANTKTKASKNEITAGGPATNAAIACSHLGAETHLVTPIGAHSLSRFVADDIINYGVKLIDPIENIDSKPVFASVITNELNGERTIFSYHPEHEHKLIMEELNLGKLSNFNIAMFDGFYPELSINIAKELRKNGVTTVLDGGSWKPGIEELLPLIDIAICSNDFTPPGRISKKSVVDVLNNYSIDKIAITRGEKSILAYTTNMRFELQIPKVEAKDTLGAGDFFHGAFCYYYAVNNDFELALKAASTIASKSCCYCGTREWMNVNDDIVK